jgi:hypothetical protein
VLDFELKKLRDLGAFRTITAASLRKHLYHGDEERFRKELRNRGQRHRLNSDQATLCLGV